MNRDQFRSVSIEDHFAVYTPKFHQMKRQRVNREPNLVQITRRIRSGRITCGDCPVSECVKGDCPMFQIAD